MIRELAAAGFLAMCVLPVIAVADGSATKLVADTLTATPDPEHGKVLFLKHCTGCHSRQGWGDGPKAIPALAGQHERYLIVQLARFATAERKNSLMQESTHPPDVDRPQAIRDLAAWLAVAPRSPGPELGRGLALARGKDVYRSACLTCHGDAGEGTADGRVPAVGGQQFRYLLSRLRDFAAVHRRDVDAALTDAATKLSDEERESLVAYLSRLGYLTSAGPQQAVH